MTFKYSDAGRSKSKRPRQKVDCTVRSLALVTGIPYDEAYEILAKAGRGCSKGFDIERWLRKNAITRLSDEPSWGYVPNTETVIFRITKMGRKPGQARLYRLSDFIADHPKGSYIVSTAGHVSAVIDGVILDDSPVHYVGDRPVYGWMEPVRCFYDDSLWQAYAVRQPIKPGGRPYKRVLGLVSSRSSIGATVKAAEWYGLGCREGETIEVAKYGNP